MPAMAMQEALIVKEASVLWEKARERGEPSPMLTVNMGNPMKVGPVSRKQWMSCSAEDTWEALMVKMRRIQRRKVKQKRVPPMSGSLSVMVVVQLMAFHPWKILGEPRRACILVNVSPRL